MSDKFILNEQGDPVPASDFMEWAAWYETAKRHVGDETIGESRISTVFLGLNHEYRGGPPILWETMVFGGPLDQHQDRCAGNREQAEAMHAAMVAKVKEASK